MDNTKSTLKDIFLLCLLPVMSLFSFLFYVFWTYPVQILSQELTINEYFLFNNLYLQISFLLCVILFITLIVTSKKFPKLFPYVLGSVLVCLIWTFLYKITSYDFGTFIDNNSLTTSESILGYSFWYFTLDLIFPVISILIIIFALKKDFYKPILLLFFLFYSIENARTLTHVKILPPSLSSTTNTIALSSNKPNLLFFMFDSVSTPIILDIITNQWSDEQKAWTKDFTFYDNVTSLSLGRTLTSLPNMIGGYQYSPQNQLKDAINNKNAPKNNKQQFYPNPAYYYTDRAFQEVSKSLTNNIDISVSFADSLTDILSELNTEISPVNIPIINVSLYQYMPYLLKKYLVVNRTKRQNSFSWSNKFPAQWVFDNSMALILSQKTEKPVFYYFENQGLHAPHTSPKYPTRSFPHSIEDTKDVFFQQITHNMRMLNNLITILKRQNIYDTTRIIVVSDHGVTLNNTNMLKYLRSLSTPQQNNFYKNTYFHNSELNTDYLPVMLMDKNFNTTQVNMKMDSRFLSLGDLHGSILNTFSTNTKIPDYLVKKPPNRVFNIPYIRPEEINYFTEGFNESFTDGYGGEDQKKFIYSTLLTNNKLTFVKVNSVVEGDFEIDSYDLDKIGDLPPVEILE